MAPPRHHPLSRSSSPRLIALLSTSLRLAGSAVAKDTCSVTPHIVYLPREITLSLFHSTTLKTLQYREIHSLLSFYAKCLTQVWALPMGDELRHGYTTTSQQSKLDSFTSNIIQYSTNKWGQLTIIYIGLPKDTGSFGIVVHSGRSSDAYIIMTDCTAYHSCELYIGNCK